MNGQRDFLSPQLHYTLRHLRDIVINNAACSPFSLKGEQALLSFSILRESATSEDTGHARKCLTQAVNWHAR
jgi:hypothetical protein